MRKTESCRRTGVAASSGSAEGRIQGAPIGAIAPPETCESNFIRNDFVQFGKYHSRCKAIFPSSVSSQQRCEVISPTVAKP